jgi:hypothetical protein
MLRRICEYLRNADIGRFGANGCFLARRLGAIHGPLYAAFSWRKLNIKTSRNEPLANVFRVRVPDHNYYFNVPNFIIPSFFIPKRPVVGVELAPLKCNQLENIGILLDVRLLSNNVGHIGVAKAHECRTRWFGKSFRIVFVRRTENLNRKCSKQNS